MEGEGSIHTWGLPQCPMEFWKFETSPFVVQNGKLCFSIPRLINYICWSDQDICFDHYHTSSAMGDLFQTSIEITMCFVSVGDVQVQVRCPLQWRVCWEQETWPGAVQLSWWIPVWRSVQFSVDTVISLLLNGRVASGQDLKSSESFFFCFPGEWAN